MAEQYLLGIDCGNTVSKASLFDLNGHEVCVASRSAETITPQPGWAERDMEKLWSDTVEVIRELLQQAGISGRDIAAVGCTGHGNGLYVLDKSGKPYRNAIQSIDARAANLLGELETQGIRERLSPYTPQAVFTSQTAILLRWMKQHKRANYDQIGAVLMCKDFINYCLTGELVSDYTDMCAANFVDIQSLRYSSEILTALDIPEIAPSLPRLAQSLEIIGHITAGSADVTGLAQGTPVIAGMIDTHASAMGGGAVEPGQACIIVGTWSINQVIIDQPLLDKDIFLMLPFADPRYWLAMEASATSASNLEWFVKNFCAEERLEAAQRGISVYDVCNEVIAAISPEESSVLFYPFLYATNVSNQTQASFHQVTGWHTRGHLLRGVYEGVAFSHLWHIQKLRQAGANFEKARLAGGGARSTVWAQIFADLLGVTIEVPEGVETGTRGAALAAGIGAALYLNCAEAVERGVTVTRIHEPQRETTLIYQQRFEQYTSLLE